MKKVIIAIAASLMAFSVSAQVSIDDIPTEREFSHVFNSDIPLNKKLVNAKTWIATNFGDYKSVLQYEDSENYRIIIKGKSPIRKKVTNESGMKWTREYHYTFTMVFDFKDDRYRIRFEDINILVAVLLNDKSFLSDTDIKWDTYFTLSTSETEKDLEELRGLREQTLSIMEGLRRKKDIAEAEATLATIDERIADKEDYIINRAPKEHIEDVLHFKMTFCDLFNSAAKGIETDDEF